MTRPFLLLPFFVAVALLATGCFRNDQWSHGDLGRTEWQLYDGLCPSSGCDLTVPVAPEQHVTFTVKGVDMHALTLTADGASGVSFTPETAAAGHVPMSAQIAFTAPTTPGEVTMHLVDAAHAEVDTAHLNVRAPTGVVCGVLPGTSVDWKLTSLEETDTISVSLSRDASRNLQVGCRGFDASGPIMTRYAIHWSSDSSRAMQLVSDFSSAPYTSADGARIYFRPIATGTTHVHVSVGDVTRDLTVETVP